MFGGHKHIVTMKNWSVQSSQDIVPRMEISKLTWNSMGFGGVGKRYDVLRKGKIGKKILKMRFEYENNLKSRQNIPEWYV